MKKIPAPSIAIATAAALTAATAGDAVVATAVIAVVLTIAAAAAPAAELNAKLTDAQVDPLKAGDLHLGMHSDAHKDGENRAPPKE